MGGIKCSRDASFAFFIIFLVLFIVAFSTPFWYAVDGVSDTLVLGLWIVCANPWDDGDCVRIDDAAPSELKSAQAMMCIAFIFYGAALVTYCVWMSKSPFYLAQRGVGRLGISSLCFTMVGGVFNMLGVVIFGAHYTTDLFEDDWGDIDVGDLYYHGSFIGAFLTAIGHLLNGFITLIVMNCCYKPQGSNANVTSAVEMSTVANTGVAVAVITESPAVTPAYPPPQGYQPQTPSPTYPPPQGYQPQTPSPAYPPPQGYQPHTPSPAYPPPQGYQPQQTPYNKPGSEYHNQSTTPSIYPKPELYNPGPHNPEPYTSYPPPDYPHIAGCPQPGSGYHDHRVGLYDEPPPR